LNLEERKRQHCCRPKTAHQIVKRQPFPSTTVPVILSLSGPHIQIADDVVFALYTNRNRTNCMQVDEDQQEHTLECRFFEISSSLQCRAEIGVA